MKCINELLGNICEIIKLDIDDCNQNNYNNLLLDKFFWNLFVSKKILIYQEDTVIFNGNVEQFLHYDYIGAPWTIEQKENQNNVGNGGFSLCDRKKMIECLNKKMNGTELKLSENVLSYIKNSKLDNIPEDVFFSNSMIYGKIGEVAPFEIAQRFSQELVYSENSFGGHCWWLYTELKKTYDFNTCFTKIFKSVAVYSPYEYTRGGGEFYISNLMKYFIKNGYMIMFFNPSNNKTADETFDMYMSEYEKQHIKLIHCEMLYNNEFKESLNVDYFVYMSNSAIPDFIGIGKYNIYHCQFPFDYENPHIMKKYINDIDRINTIINSYNLFIVNSDFTKECIVDHYGKISCTNQNKIKVLYPVCDIEKNKISIGKKNPGTFCMIGRIFKHDPDANNKFFVVAIDVFNKIDEDYELNIIGSVKNADYYAKLCKKIKNKDKIKFWCDIDDEQKIMEDISINKNISGIGMSDSGWSTICENNFDYKNTFYHKPPFLDIYNINHINNYQNLDFVISSDVFEHIDPYPNIQIAFNNLNKILKKMDLLCFLYLLQIRNT